MSPLIANMYDEICADLHFNKFTVGGAASRRVQVPDRTRRGRRMTQSNRWLWRDERIEVTRFSNHSVRTRQSL